MRRLLTGLGLIVVFNPLYAATSIDLSRESLVNLQRQLSVSTSIQFVELSRHQDFNSTLHVRLQQKYQGYQVWGADSVLHAPRQAQAGKSWLNLMTPQATMNGLMYKDIEKDLADQPATIFTEAKINHAIEYVVGQYQVEAKGHKAIKVQQARLMVYIDNKQNAHWAIYFNMLVPAEAHAVPTKPTYIIDAANFNIYQQWDDLKTTALENVAAGGFGGNHKVGQKIFDGLPGHQMKLMVQRDANNAICRMRNDFLVIRDAKHDGYDITFPCQQPDIEHNNVYWNGSHDKVATTWSPSNDALFGAQVTKNMFQDWYNMPMLVKNGKPMYLPITVHDDMENAYWDGGEVVFGDSVGSDTFNPFTQLDTVSHEICHGFTEQHSGLEYYGQSGGLNEAFSDMAGMAAEFYAYGETSFLVGWGDVKAEGEALRYMDQPSKDCKGKTPGHGCSIDHMSQYTDYLNVHYSSGIFNRVYYTLATTPDWNARKVFDVMVQANINYWTSTTSFEHAACGVMKAAKDYSYNLKDVVHAFSVVGLDASKC